MSVLSFPPDSPRLWDITCYIFHQMENIFSVIIFDFLRDNITGANRSGIRPMGDKNYNHGYFLKLHTHVISFVMAAKFIWESLAEQSGWHPPGSRWNYHEPGSSWTSETGHCQEVEPMPVCISLSAIITSPSQIIIIQSFRWHNARNVFSGAQLKSHSRVFSVLSLNHLLQGWIQLFLQAPINLTINHGPNKIVLIINLPTPWYG